MSLSIQEQAILFKCLNLRTHYRHIVFRSLFGDISRSDIYRETWISQGNLRAVGKTNLHRRTKSRRTEIVLVKYFCKLVRAYVSVWSVYMRAIEIAECISRRGLYPYYLNLDQDDASCCNEKMENFARKYLGISIPKFPFFFYRRRAYVSCKALSIVPNSRKLKK